MRKFVVLFLISLVLLLNSTEINTSSVSGTWSKQDSPFNINCDITVPDGATLSIEPGTEIVFKGHYRFNVQGCLNAAGSEADSIIIRAANQETGWMGIRFVDTPVSNPKSNISYCIIKDGNANLINSSDYSGFGGGILFNNYSKAEVSNCYFTNNRASAGSAIACITSSPNITDNVFRGNRSGYEVGSGYATIECNVGSSPVISNNLIEKNWCIGEKYAAGAGLRLLDNSNPMIKNNIIRENWIVSDGNLSEGTALYIHRSDPILINNLIYDNYIMPEGTHGSGGAIFFYDSYAKLINNTIKTNYAREGGALWFKLSSPDFHNNIIRGNEASTLEEQIFFDDDGSDPNFYHNNIEGGKENFGFKYSWYTFTGAWVNNIDEDPKYEDNGNGLNYNLSSDSPCIDTGSLDFTLEIPLEELDLLRNDRIFGYGIDIGAIEAHLACPSAISVSVSSSIVSMSWEVIPGALSYVIYSSEDPFGQFEQEAVVTTNSYQGSVSGTRKFYYIRSKN
jgi:hypothetical protein